MFQEITIEDIMAINGGAGGFWTAMTEGAIKGGFTGGALGSLVPGGGTVAGALAGAVIGAGVNTLKHCITSMMP